MASITLQIPIAADADTVWAAVRDVGHPHHLFAGVLTDAHLDGDTRRFPYAVVDGLMHQGAAAARATLGC